MKGGNEHRILLAQDRVGAMCGKHLDPVADTLDERRTDEHGVKPCRGLAWSTELVDDDLVGERLVLAAIAVSFHANINRRETLLIGSTVAHTGCQQDHACARAEHRHGVGHTRRYWFPNVVEIEHHRHRC